MTSNHSATSSLNSSSSDISLTSNNNSATKHSSPAKSNQVVPTLSGSSSFSLPIIYPPPSSSTSDSLRSPPHSFSIKCGHFSMQGVRNEMEDKVILLPHPEFNKCGDIHDKVSRSFFAVFDGHGGDVSAEYCIVGGQSITNAIGGGSPIAIEEIVREFPSIKQDDFSSFSPFTLLSMNTNTTTSPATDDHFTTSPSRVLSVSSSGLRGDCVEIELSNGTKLQVTSDHRVRVNSYNYNDGEDGDSDVNSFPSYWKNAQHIIPLTDFVVCSSISPTPLHCYKKTGILPSFPSSTISSPFILNICPPSSLSFSLSSLPSLSSLSFSFSPSLSSIHSENRLILSFIRLSAHSLASSSFILPFDNFMDLASIVNDICTIHQSETLDIAIDQNGQDSPALAPNIFLRLPSSLHSLFSSSTPSIITSLFSPSCPPSLTIEFISSFLGACQIKGKIENQRKNPLKSLDILIPNHVSPLLTQQIVRFMNSFGLNCDSSLSSSILSLPLHSLSTFCDLFGFRHRIFSSFISTVLSSRFNMEKEGGQTDSHWQRSELFYSLQTFYQLWNSQQKSKSNLNTWESLSFSSLIIDTIRSPSSLIAQLLPSSSPSSLSLSVFSFLTSIPTFLVPVKSVTALPGLHPTYDLSVSHHSNFMVSSVVVHNCRQHVHMNFLSEKAFLSDPLNALKAALLRTDAEFCGACRRINLLTSSGTTALAAYVFDSKLVVANIGDSRGVLMRGGKPIPISIDHKPGRKEEKDRIELLGGRVGISEDEAFSTAPKGCLCLRKCLTARRPLRVFPGGLSVSRTIGDISMKSTALIIAEPELFECEIQTNDSFVILACDGVWDVMSNQQAVDAVKKYAKDPEDAARQLAKEAFRRGSTDNISVIIILFQHGVSDGNGTSSSTSVFQSNGNGSKSPTNNHPAANGNHRNDQNQNGKGNGRNNENDEKRSS